MCSYIVRSASPKQSKQANNRSKATLSVRNEGGLHGGKRSCLLTKGDIWCLYVSSLLHSLKPLSLRCACMSHNLQDRQISLCRCNFRAPWNQEAFDLSAMPINWSCLLVWAHLGKNLEWYTSVFIPDTQCLSEYTFSQWRNLLSSKTCVLTWALQSILV